MTDPARPELNIRCGGACCRRFVIRDGIARLKRKAQSGHPGDKREAEFILDMVVPIEGETDTFSCRHLQDDGLCGVYDQRPWMCRWYPKGGKCRRTDCKAPDHMKEIKA